MEEFHDIRPPVMVGIEPSWITAAWIAGGVILLILVLWILFRKLRKRKKSGQGQLSMGAGLPDAFSSAMRSLDTLEKSVDQAGEGELKKSYFVLGDILKIYIGTAYEIHAREMTSQELSASMKTLPMDRKLGLQVGRFQEACDPFRYAPVRYVQDNTSFVRKILKDIQQARCLVQDMEADRQKHTINEEIGAGSLVVSREKF